MAAFLDACRFLPTAGGTGDWTYSSAVGGYLSPAGAGAANGQVYKYRAESADLTQWEIGEGSWNSSSGILTRITVLFNSAGTTAKINFSTVPQVAVVALKEDLLAISEANSFTTAQKTQARTNIGMSDGHLPAEASSGTANSGELGEEGHTSASTASNYSSGVAQNVLSFTLPAGDFEVTGWNDFSGSGATQTSDWNTIISSQSTPTVSNNGTFPGGVNHTRMPADFDYSLRQQIGPVRVSLSASTTFYMHGAVTISSGTVYTSFGYVKWRRAR
ncbi:hypothetical protein JQ604_30860 [Bradyrhizobium jicamae]|uniref:hypothetical protein n=1 Tax=Bradyrhizobium jicamae TaxID=280332 RepID=UPI001BA5A619|nr:hypothetical protein [Bradyrhizobium jicamae]MBR0756600.1 hypothetical protein [Bradyrhizobium jicamae]